MPYSATAYRLLLSTPSDLPAEDERAVFDAVARWNAVYGKSFAATVVPTHWRHHSAAEHGSRPQESLNKQLVQEADVVIALFWHRLGSDTGHAESGTVEEIDEAESHGADVAILRCTRAVPPGDLDPGQIERLDAFLERIRPNSLILDYVDADALRERVETILTRVISESGARAEAEAEARPQAQPEIHTAASRPPAQVWPRVDRRESVKTDTRGRVQPDRRWFLVLSNTGEEPAKHVKYRLEIEEGDDGVTPMEPGERRELESLAPGTDAEYQLFMHSGVADQARCVVSWEDSVGEHENIATLRFF